MRIGYRWLLLAALSIAYFLEQGTRQIYNVTLPQIRLDFLQYGVTDAQLGLVGTVFGSLGRPAAVAVIAVFAVSSILCWVHYTDTLVPLSPLIRFAVPAVCIVGIVLPSDTVWQAATFSVSLATVVNLFYLLKHQKTFFSSFG